MLSLHDRYDILFLIASKGDYKMVRAIMHGCNGRMGQVITGLIREDEGIEIVAGIDAYTGRENA